MKKIIYLIILLLVTILLSCQFNYEYMQNLVFKLKFNSIQPIDNNNHQVQIKNQSNKNIFIVFTLSAATPLNVLKEKWKFFKNTTVEEEPTTSPIENTIYFGPYMPNTIFSCQYIGGGIPQWESAKCSITLIRPTVQAIQGLTALEWTFLPGGNFNPDLSSLEGINIKADMRVIDGINCDTSGIKECKIDFDNEINCKFIGKDLNGIPSIRKPSYNASTDKQYAGYEDSQQNIPSKCGYVDNPNQENCIECPFKEDPCKNVKKHVLTDKCYTDSIKYKWGCYKWWANPENQKAKDWLNVYKTGEGCTNSYKWVFDETGIYLPEGEQLKTINKPFLEDDETWEKSFWKYKCATIKLKDLDIDKSKCIGYPTTKDDGPNINCDPPQLGINTKLIFTIYDVFNKEKC